MKNIFKVVLGAVVLFTAVQCKEKVDDNKETVLTGEAVVAVDEKGFSVMQDQGENF